MMKACIQILRAKYYILWVLSIFQRKSLEFVTSLDRD